MTENRTIEEYSIKRSGAWFWKTGFSAEAISNEFPERKDAVDWLICPTGFGSNAIGVNEFLDDPDYFERLFDKQLWPKKYSNDLRETIAEGMILREVRSIHSWVRFIGVAVIIYIALWLLSLILITIK